MKWQPIAISITIVNLVLTTIVLANLRPSVAQSTPKESVPKILRAQSIEITDSLGRRRATLTIEPPATVAGIAYPQAVVFRLIDTKGAPLVKLVAAENGAGLNLSDDGDGNILLHAKRAGSYVKVKNHDGKEAVLKP
ncbi:MAG: hypothetical protein H7Y27_07420 [Gemmatimonadaceae bacterium]|nr:hypothetical protein [Chitinophagaceae bacterium]